MESEEDWDLDDPVEEANRVALAAPMSLTDRITFVVFIPLIYVFLFFFWIESLVDLGDRRRGIR